MPLALAIIGDIIPPRERARYQGYFMAVFATVVACSARSSAASSPASAASSASPAGAGSSTSTCRSASSRSFVVTRGAASSTTPGASTASTGAARRRWSLGLVPLLIIAEQGRTWGWGSAGAFACYVLGVVGLVAFVRVEARMGDDALLPLRLFRNSVFAVGSAQALDRRHGDVRRHRLDPALPADRQGRVADQGRPADPAAGRRA